MWLETEMEKYSSNYGKLWCIQDLYTKRQIPTYVILYFLQDNEDIILLLHI